MIKEAIEKLLEVGKRADKPEVMTIKGRTYTDKTVLQVHDPMPVALVVSTLTALVDYITGNVDRLEYPDLIVQVDGPSRVVVLSKLSGDFVQRAEYLAASPILPSYRFDTWLPTDVFIPMLQATFQDTGHRAALLKLAGGVRMESSADLRDDGVTQHVTARTGVARIEQVEVPSPCTLRPFSTFLEVEQPDRLFVFRMERDGDGVDCTLIDADGGAWKQAAALAVRDYLREHLPKGVQVIA